MGASGSNLVENEHLGLDVTQEESVAIDNIWEALEAQVKNIIEANRDKSLDDLENAQENPLVTRTAPDPQTHGFPNSVTGTVH